MSNRIINHLINSITTRETVCSYNHYSGIYKNGKVMGLGNNHHRNTYNGECICWSTHAEMDVLFKVLKDKCSHPFKDIVNLNDHTIVVIRYGKDGMLKNSRPCNNCLDTIKKYNIKKIIYSTDLGTVISEKPNNMEYLHISSGWKYYLKK